MKKRFLSVARCLVVSMAFAGTFCTTSCNDDEIANNEVAPKGDAIVKNNDLTNGYCMLITNIDDLDDERIALNTAEPVDVKSHNGQVTFECVKEGGKFYLKPQLMTDFEGETIIDQITITDAKGQTKDVMVSVRDNMGSTRSSDSTDVDPSRNRLNEIFAYGIQPWVMVGAAGQSTGVSEPVFNRTQLFNYVEVVGNEPVVGEVRKVEGSSLDEITENMSVSGGVSGVLPFFPAAASGISFSHTTETKTKHYYEYFTEYRNTTEAVGTLRYSQLADTVIAKIIDRTFNEYLNNDLADEKFPMDEKGTMKLLRIYGTHFSTYCKIGSQCRVNFRKKQDMMSSKTDIQAAFELKRSVDAAIKAAGKADASLDEKIKAYNLCKDDTYKGNINIGVSQETYSEDTEMETNVVMIGGKFGDGTADTWTTSEDPKDWMPLTFVRSDGEREFPSLHPITELCINKNSQRYALIKKILNDEELLKEYYTLNDKDFKTKEGSTKWVIAGFEVNVCSSAKEYEPYRSTCPDGVVRTFYPMAYKDGCNKDCEDYYGTCLDTQYEAFVTLVKSGAHVWYYALAMEEDCPGLANITVAENEPRNYEKSSTAWVNSMRPSSSSFSNGWAGALTHLRVWVQPIREADRGKIRPITAVALIDDCYRTLGSTGGSEYGKTTQSHERYDKMWTNWMGPGQKEGTIHLIDSGEIGKNGCYDATFFVHQGNKLFLKYSINDLPIEKSKPIGIQHPSNMKKNAKL